MSEISVAFRDIVRGKTIELDSEPELPDGQEVSVTLLTVGDPSATLTDAERRWAEARVEVENVLQVANGQKTTLSMARSGTRPLDVD